MMRAPKKSFIALVAIVATALAVVGAPRERPAKWAAPVIGTTLENCHRVGDELYRCGQPGVRDLSDLKSLGIRSVLNLREYHTDSERFSEAGIALLVHRIDTRKISLDDLVASLRLIRDAPKPVMVHCWHGSDRTGAVVAGYRIVFEDWTPADALDELRNGGFGHHERWFPNIVELFESLDAEELKRRVFE